jgi:tRNA A37 methylthiotransferase MiaB
MAGSVRKPRLIDLMEGLAEIEGVMDRPLYLYPDLVSMTLIDAMAQMQKVCNYWICPFST